MKCNKLFRRLRKLGVGKKLSARIVGYFPGDIYIVLPYGMTQDAYNRELKHIRQLIRKGARVIVLTGERLTNY